MVAQSIDENLLSRIQTFVANDINNRRMSGHLLPAESLVQPKEVYILAFSRILNNWQAVAAIEDESAGYYQLSHDGTTDQTLAGVYYKEFITEAII